jgi:flagellar biosynthetic protein FliP
MTAIRIVWTVLTLLLGALTTSGEALAQTGSHSSASSTSPGATQNLSVNQLGAAAKPATAPGQKSLPLLSINLADSENPDDLVPMLRVVAILTIVTLAPAILLLMSAFTRILIVLSFFRQALGSPSLPPNQVLIGLSLFLTYFVMAPTVNTMYDKAIVPYMEKKLTAGEAFQLAQAPVRDFMLNQTHKEDLRLFYQISKEPQPKTAADIPMRILIPSFVTSELKAAFQIGFIVYLPFIVVDMIVSSVLMAMGMMMLPPTVVSLPLKIILFVLVDGWNLLVGSLVRSFAT